MCRQKTFTNAFSVLAAYALLATAYGTPVHDELLDALARLEAVKGQISAAASAAMHGRDVAAEPATVLSDVQRIVSEGTTMGSDIAKLLADVKSNPQDAAQPNAAIVTTDALKVSSDVSTLVSDIAKLVADSKAE